MLCWFDIIIILSVNSFDVILKITITGTKLLYYSLLYKYSLYELLTTLGEIMEEIHHRWEHLTRIIYILSKKLNFLV